MRGLLVTVCLIIACHPAQHTRKQGDAPHADAAARRAAALLQEYTDEQHMTWARFDELTEEHVRADLSQRRFIEPNVLDLARGVRAHPVRQVTSDAVVAFIGWDEKYSGGAALGAVVVGEAKAIAPYARRDATSTSADWRIAAVPQPDWILGVASTQREREEFEQRLKAVDEELLRRWFFHGDREAFSAIREQVRGS